MLELCQLPKAYSIQIRHTEILLANIFGSTKQVENENFQKLKEISKTKEAEKISYDPFISSCRVSGFYFKPQRCQKFSKKLLHFLNILNTLRNSAFPLRVALRRDIVLFVCLFAEE